ncbi:MAG: LPS export ABC transporter periplasmic protein LptC [Spirochaetaceae bacterium]|jgi:LPS export ABC transporter protein LptC|nr:LPS export ABC transporter periplasmic protein LptC [Spirochaetaceae bacterium]
MNLKMFVTRILTLAAGAGVLSCTFDYGETEQQEVEYPDLTMEQLEYVRVREGTPIAKLEADIGDRYEKRHTMELKNFSFQQYDIRDGSVDAVGSGGKALVETDTGNVRMSERIHIQVDSEDMSIKTEGFDWKDKSKTLTGMANQPVTVEQSNGTNFSGNGFSADLRSKTWIFASDVGGIYFYEDEENENENASENTGENANENVNKNEDAKKPAENAVAPAEANSGEPEKKSAETQSGVQTELQTGAQTDAVTTTENSAGL